MAFTLKRFIRAVSSETLQRYFTLKHIDLPADLAWDSSSKLLAERLAAHVASLPHEIRATIFSDWDRADQIADEAGERALLDSCSQREALLAAFVDLPSRHDRALHVLLSDPPGFSRAEHLRYVDLKRHGRMWSGYVVPAGLKLSSETSAQAALKAALKAHFSGRDGSGRNIEIDNLEHSRTNDDRSAELVQVMVYLEGLPLSSLEFEGDRLTRRTQRPATEIAWTYAPETGALEVLATGGNPVRRDLAKLLLVHLGGAAGDPADVPLRQVQLDGLRTSPAFVTDAEDGIEAVTVRRLRLRPLNRSAGSVVLEQDAGSDQSVYDLSATWFGINDPLRGGFRITQARLAIEFRPVGDKKRGKVISFELSAPNGSTLREHVDAQRLVSEKYLERWGLVLPA